MAPTVSWQSIQAEALRRIQARDWKPGDTIPHESVLAEEFGCARATVHRALRKLAEAGLLERRRKSGTRVPLNPVYKATFEIAIIRKEVEAGGHAYGYRLIETAQALPPPEILTLLRLPARTRLLHVVALHEASGSPFCLEDRWINPGAVPGLELADFRELSANEWLVQNVALSRIGIEFFALAADAGLAAHLQCPQGSALFVIERTTWAGSMPITAVQLIHAPGYRLTAAT